MYTSLKVSGELLFYAQQDHLITHSAIAALILGYTQFQQ